MAAPVSQRVHEQHGAGRCMAQATRGLLLTAYALVLVGAIIAGINSSEYTLTLALGVMLATVMGLGFMTQANTTERTERSLLGGNETVNHISHPLDATEKESLPDPMAQDFEMPL